MFREGEPREYNPQDDAGPIIEGEIISESREKITPEQALDTAVTAVEDKEQDPSWLKKHKKGLLITGGIGAGVTGAVAAWGPKVLLYPFIKFAVVPLFLFAKKLIEKKGKLSYKDGTEIADKTFGMFGLGDKKKS